MIPIEPEHVINYLSETYNFGPDLLQDMLSSVRESLNMEFLKVEKGLAENDIEMLWKAAHSIKGALLNAGAEDWAELSRKIELSGKAQEDVDYERLFLELKDGLRGLL